MANPPMPPISVTELGSLRLIRALELAYYAGRQDEAKGVESCIYEAATSLAGDLLAGLVRLPSEGEELRRRTSAVTATTPVADPPEDATPMEDS